jgi:glycosyltransferase involved in cell wall biosynthesis
MGDVTGARVLCLVFGPNPSTEVRAVGRRRHAAALGIDWSIVQLEPIPSCMGILRILGRYERKAQRLIGKLMTPVLFLFHARRIRSAEVVYVIKTPPLWVSRWVARWCPVRVYDFDDPLWIPEMKGEEWFQKTLSFYPQYSCDNQFAIEYVEVSSAKSEGIILPGEMPQPPTARRALKDRGFSLIWVGSYTTFRYLFDIAPALRAFFVSHPEARLLLLGTESSQVASLGIPLSNIVFKAKYGPEEMSDYLSRAHAGLFPLTDEPLAYLRGTHKINVYNAFGLPTISSPVLGMEQAIEQGISGFVCRDEADWITALTTLSENEVLLHAMSAIAVRNHRALIRSLEQAPEVLVEFARKAQIRE